MARKRRRKYKKRKFKLNLKVVWIIIFSLFGMVLLFGLVYAIYTLSIFKVKQTDIESNIALSRSLKEEIVGESLFTLDIKSISSQLLRENPGCKKIYVIKKFPSTVIIDAKKRGFFVQVKAKKFYPLDREAVVLTEGRLTPYEHLISIESGINTRSFSIGDEVSDKRLEAAFNLIDTLEKKGFLNEFSVESVNSANLAAMYFLIDTSGFFDDETSGQKDLRVIIGDRDFSRRLSLLKGVINQELKEKLSSVEYIDLRHRKVYVGFRR